MSLEIPQIDLPHFNSGKVRESYELDPNHLLFVTSDRISVYDVVLPEEIPNKGRILNAMSSFWFDQLRDIVPNQQAEVDTSALPEVFNHPYYAGRVAVAKRAKMFPIECIVRGHLTGSAWDEYRTTGTIHNMSAPAGLRESERLPEHMFTPSTKAPKGEHDVNLSHAEATAIVGDEAFQMLEALSLALYTRMYNHAEERGIILADTKLEFGELEDGLVIVCDEAGTPDSSRYWPADLVVVGQTPPSFDKQYVRDHAAGTGWNKKPPAPHLPQDVIDNTVQKYTEAYERVTGRRIQDIPGIAA